MCNVLQNVLSSLVACNMGGKGDLVLKMCPAELHVAAQAASGGVHRMCHVQTARPYAWMRTRAVQPG